VARNKLYEWVELEKQHGESAFPGSGRKPDDEMTKLKRELEQLKEENEILKKAAAYFAKHLP
jgi:transposase